MIKAVLCVVGYRLQEKRMMNVLTQFPMEHRLRYVVTLLDLEII